MYVDLVFLFLIYCFATIALGVSIYSLWTLKEIEEYYKKKNKKPTTSTWANKPPIKVDRAKGLWD